MKGETISSTECMITKEAVAQSSTNIIPANNVVIATRVGLGKVCLIDQDTAINQDLRGIIPKSENNLSVRYLFWWLKSVAHKIEAAGMGATVKGVKLPFVKSLRIPVPERAEQQRIVAILDEAFAGIATAAANAEKNLQNARELFESTRQAIFAEKGEAWKEKKFGEICGFVRGPFGGSLKKSCFTADGFAVYEQQHAIYNQFQDIRYYIDESKFNEMRRFEVFPGELIMSCSGTIGKLAIVPDGVKRGIINQALLKLSPSERLSAKFLKYWLESAEFQIQIEMHSQGAAIKNVASVKVLKEIEVPCPPLDEQLQIVEELDSLVNYSQQLEAVYKKKLDALSQLKQSILQKAFAGELH